MNINDKENKEKVQEEIIQENGSFLGAEDVQARYVDIKAKYVQLLADVENMKKRASKEHEMQRDALTAVLFGDLLAIVDNFERALSQKNDQQESLYQGVSMIHTSLLDFLKKWGVVEMSNYAHFDPLFHEALMQVEDDEKTSGDIAQVLQKGYLVHGKILRTAKVSVVK